MARAGWPLRIGCSRASFPSGLPQLQLVDLSCCVALVGISQTRLRLHRIHFDEVASGPTYKQGRFFPSDEIDRVFVDAWNSEGDLVSTTASYLGDDVVAAAFRRHRETYISDVDLATMRDADIGVMRFNVGW